MPDRFDVLMRVFKEGSELQMKQLAQTAGVTTKCLSPKSRAVRAALVEKVATGAAALLHMDFAQLMAWLTGEPEPAVAEYLQMRLDMRRCNDCQNWFALSEMIERLGLCRRCARLKQTPEVAKWEDEVRRRMPGVVDPIIRKGWEIVAARPAAAMKHSDMARASGVTILEWRRRWREAQLPQKRRDANEAQKYTFALRQIP